MVKKVIVEKKSGKKPAKIYEKKTINRKNTSNNSGKSDQFDAHSTALLSDPYLHTLVDPFTSSPAKIPSGESFKTACFKSEMKLQITISHGYGGMALGINNRLATDPNACLVPMDDWLEESSEGYPSRIGMIGQMHYHSGTTPTMATKLLEPTPDAYLDDSYGIWIPNWYYTHEREPASTKKGLKATGDVTGSTGVGVPQYYQKVRLVSAGITCDYKGAPLNAQGDIIALVLPPNTWRGDIDNKTFADLLTAPGVIREPINKLNGMTLKYKPLDAYNFMFNDTSTFCPWTDSSELDYTVRRQFAKPWLGNEMYLFFAGCDSSTTLTVDVTVVLNYEGIVRYNNMNMISPTPARIDSTGLSEVMNVVQHMPPVHVGSKATKGTNLTDSLTHSAPRQVPTFVKRMSQPQKHKSVIRDIITTGGEIAKYAIPIVKEIANLL
jgi:hypothetical protein